MHKTESDSARPKWHFAIQQTTAAGHRCFLHAHACVELVWHRGGGGWMPQGARRFRYEDGDLTICRAGERHGDESETTHEQLCFGVAGCGVEDLPTGVWKPDDAVRAALAFVHAEARRPDPWSAARKDLLSGWLVLELRRQIHAQEPTRKKEPRPVTKARRIFDTRFHEPLTIAGVAEELAIHPDYLRQLFSAWAGESPLRYLIRKRLESACDLLRLNQESSARIAEKVGIGNPYYFSRLFRNRFGVTPTRYRNRYAGT